MYDHDTMPRAQSQAPNACSVSGSVSAEPTKKDKLLHKLTAKHAQSIRAAQLFEQLHLLSDNALVNTYHCGDVVVTLEDDNGAARLHQAYYCKQRLCPGCAYRASLARAACNQAIISAMVTQGRKPIMVTLTVPNVHSEDLRQQILDIGRATDRLMRRKRYQTWGDYVRKLEVTYNPKACTYHPHVHMIVFVRPGYFSHGDYISHAQLLDDWRRATGDDSITQVDIRRVNADDPGAILEISKYVAKADDYLSSPAVFGTYYHALYHIRTHVYAHACKTLRKQYRDGLLSDYLRPDTVDYVWQVIYADYDHTMQYTEQTRHPYIADVPLSELTAWDCEDDI